MDETPVEPPYRRLTLIELMGLIAVSALALMAWQAEQQIFDTVPEWPFEVPNWCNIAGGQILTLAWFVVARGLTRFRAERQQPGYLTAVCLVLASLWISLMNYQVVKQRNGPMATPDPGRWIVVYVFGSPTPEGMAIAAAAVACGWTTLALSRAWLPAGGTLDRVGLLLGGATLILTVGWYGWLLLGSD